MTRKSSQAPRLNYVSPTGESSDLTLVCEGIEFAVHKGIVCTQSPVLAAACYGQYMKEKVSVIRVHKFHAGIVKHMIDFMYSGTYGAGSVTEQGPAVDDDIQGLYEMAEEALDSDSETDWPQDSSTPSFSSPSSSTDRPESGIMFKLLLPHVRVNSIADYYGLKELMMESCNKIVRIIELWWSPDGFMSLVQHVLETSSYTLLHNILAKAVVDHYRELIILDDLAKYNLVHWFILDLVKMMSNRLMDAEDREQMINSKETRLDVDRLYVDRWDADRLDADQWDVESV